MNYVDSTFRIGFVSAHVLLSIMVTAVIAIPGPSDAAGDSAWHVASGTGERRSTDFRRAMKSLNVNAPPDEVMSIANRLAERERNAFLRHALGEALDQRKTELITRIRDATPRLPTADIFELIVPERGYLCHGLRAESLHQAGFDLSANHSRDGRPMRDHLAQRINGLRDAASRQSRIITEIAQRFHATRQDRRHELRAIAVQIERAQLLNLGYNQALESCEQILGRFSRQSEGPSGDGSAETAQPTGTSGISNQIPGREGTAD